MKNGNPYFYIQFNNNAMVNSSLNLNSAIPFIKGMERHLKGTQIISAVSTLSGEPDLVSNELTEISNILSILSSAQLGTWLVNLNTRELHFCPTAVNLLNLGYKKTVSLQWLFLKLSKLNQTSFLNAIKDIWLKQEGIDEELFIKAGNNQDGRWFRVIGKVYQENGKAVKVMGVIMDITNTKLEDIRKKDLMAFLCHELKTPLSVVKLCVENSLWMMENDIPFDIEEKLHRSDQQVMSMSSLIDNFLSLSMVENAMLNMESSVFDVGQLLQETMSDMAFLNPHHIFKGKLTKPIMVAADRDKIRQVLINYMSNAVKFSPENGTIHMKCKTFQRAVVVTVTDHGIGITHDDQKVLFNRYRRIHSKGATRVKGFGLGLFLSREIIEKHGGCVWVESSPGLGATFAFSIPYSAKGVH